MVFMLLAVVMVNGLGVFWPAQVAEVTLADGSKFFGQTDPQRSESRHRRVEHPVQDRQSRARPAAQDFRWVKDDAIRAIAYPAEVCVLERIENGDFYGYVKGVAGPDLAPSSEAAVGEDLLRRRWTSIRRKSAEEIAPIAAELFALSNQLQETRDKLLRLSYRKDRLAGGCDRRTAGAATETGRLGPPNRGTPSRQPSASRSNPIGS